MKRSFKIQYHPNQEDKTGNPTYASGTRLNYSTNESRLDDDNIGSDLKSNYRGIILRKSRKKSLK